MATFSDLPNEILLGILQCVLPDDIENFCLTNKTIYGMSTKARAEHSSLKEMYSEFRDYKPGQAMGIAEYVGHILENPRARYYVRDLGIDGWYEKWEPAHLRYDDELLSRLQMEASKLLPPKVADLAVSKITEGDKSPLIALLLLLLPNLTRLIWNKYQEADGYILNILSYIANRINSEGPLSRLRKVIIGTKSEDQTNLNTFASFAMLQSVQTLWAWETWNPVTCYNLGRDLGVIPQVSNVAELHFSGASINPKDLHVFLKSFQALQDFSWIGQSDKPTKRSQQDQLFDPFWITASLAAHARGTLRTLTLVSLEPRWRWMGDLRVFGSLQSLTTELELLLKISDANGMISLAQVLPKSVRSLRLYSWRDTSGELKLPGLINHWASEKERMSGLQEIEIATDRSPPRHCLWLPPDLTFSRLVEKCRGIDVQLTVVRADERRFDNLLEKTSSDDSSNDPSIDLLHDRIGYWRGHKKFCVCHCDSEDVMISCKNSACSVGWFHLQCVGIDKVLQTSWYCPKCLKKEYARSMGDY